MPQVVILAGGKGTRLRERLGDLPKPLVNVCGVPLLERQIELVKRYGFERVLILVNHQADKIIDFCRGKGNWGLDINLVDEGEPRGTAGAVLGAFELLEDEFLVMYGDTMLEVDLGRFRQYHLMDPTTAATLFLHPNDHPRDSDLVEMDRVGNVTAFHPYPHDPAKYYSNLVNAALYWIRKCALQAWQDHPGGILDFGKQLFPAMLERGLTLRGYNSPEYDLKDCGTPARLDKVNADFTSGKIANSSLGRPQVAVFLDRDGTLIREVDHLNNPEQLESLPGVEQGLRRLNLAGYRTCVVSNQPVVARGECSFEDIKHIHNKLETLLGHAGAFVDRIYFCPHHPDKGFCEIKELKVECSCRKPNTGMIDAGIAELNIKREKSWMIGDSTADILAAGRAELRSILVETGHAGLDHKYWATPDFVVPDISAAINLILDTYPALIDSADSLLADVRKGDVIYVGGHSRSGKSTYASAMRDLLRERGLASKVISTDRWLLSERLRGNTLIGRHDMQQLENLVKAIHFPGARPAHLSLPGYRRSDREQVPGVESIFLSSSDIVILEGVVALHLAETVGASHRFFVEIDEELRKQRVVGEYLIRGRDLPAAEAVYAERFEEEYPWIESSGRFARRISVPIFENNTGKAMQE